MRRLAILSASWLLMVCISPSDSWGEVPGCVVPVEGDLNRHVDIFGWRDTPLGLVFATPRGLYRYDGASITLVNGGPIGQIYGWGDTTGALLLSAERGLFRYEGNSVSRVQGDATGFVESFLDTPSGVFARSWGNLFRYDGERLVQVASLAARITDWHVAPGGALVLRTKDGWFRFDGKSITPLEGGEVIDVLDWHATQGGLLVGTDKGLFRYDGTRLAQVEGDPQGSIRGWKDTPLGLLLGTHSGLFRYDGTRVIRVMGDPTGSILDWHRTSAGLLLLTDIGLFRYDSARVDRVNGDLPSRLYSRHRHWGPSWYDATSELLLGTTGGLFRYNGTSVARVPDDPIDTVNSFHNTPSGLLVAAKNGLFRYDGKSIIRVPGDATGGVDNFHNTPNGLLISAEKGIFYYDGTSVVALFDSPGTFDRGLWHDFRGEVLLLRENRLFRVHLQRPSSWDIILDNQSQLQGAAPSRLGVPIRWIINHHCSIFAKMLDLHVVAANTMGIDVSETPAINFNQDGRRASFEAWIPVPEAGQWTFRTVSTRNGVRTNIGKPSIPVLFVEEGLLVSLRSWLPIIVSGFVTVLIIANLSILIAARYSASAWRLACSECKCCSCGIGKGPNFGFWISTYKYTAQRCQSHCPSCHFRQLASVEQLSRATL
jgi:hypothetical protein